MSEPKPHDRIDDVIHQRTRLAIMAALAAVESLDFTELKADLALTDGNLSTHASALERAGYVKVTKTFRGKKPLTTLAMTPKGRKALASYVEALQNILDKAR
ncbi:MAG: transcriptional regulator [Planctomycetota bacterium]|nr:transcriptional regulator [Planctomycetota bacterium]